MQNYAGEKVYIAIDHPPLIRGEVLPDYWCRVDVEGNYYIFLAQLPAKDLKYPLYSGQSFADSSMTLELSFQMQNIEIEETVVFNPYQSLMLKVSSVGKLEYLDINYVPKDPVVRPIEKQKMYF